MKKQWLTWVGLVTAAFMLTSVLSSPVGAQDSWSYQRMITIDPTQVAGDLYDFPVLIHLSGDWLGYQASGDPGHVRQNDGGDIRFVSTNHIQLDHEIELYDGTSGTLVAWVRIPFLSGTSDTQIYMLYGNPGCEDQSNPEAVWDEHFVMVHHLEETAGTHFDSTLNRYAGEATDGVVQDAVGAMDGVLNGGDEFPGGDDWVRVAQTGWSDQNQGQQRAVIKGGKIYVVGGGDHSLSSMNAYIYVYDLVTGDLLQQSPSIGSDDFTSSETAPVVDEPRVYAASTFGEIAAWNMDTDEIEWTTNGLSVWSNRMEYDGSYLYATTTDYKVVKIDAFDGSVDYAFNLDPDTGNENAVPPYLDDVNETEDVIYAMGGSQLYKLKASDLSQVSTGSWPVSIGSHCLDDGSGHSRMAPIVVNDSYTGNEPWIITGCWGNNTFYAYDSNGNPEWSKVIPGGVRAMPSYNPNNGFVYITSQDSRIYALDIQDGDVNSGDEQFVIDSVPAGTTFDRPCTISNNYLIFKTTGGTTQYFQIFDATTGAHIVHYPIGSNLFLTCFPVAASQGYLVTGGSLINYGGSNGGIFAAKVGAGEAVDYYPLYGPQKYGYVANALTALHLVDELNPTAEITLEAWANLDVRAPAPDYMNDHLLCRADTYCLKFTQHSTGDVPRFQLQDSSNQWHNLDLATFGTLSTGLWHHLVGTWDGVNMYFYIDGIPRGTLGFAGTIRSTGNPTCIGSYNCSASPANQSPAGRLDEVRLSDIARSEAWVTTSYNNQSAPDTFFALGDETSPTAVSLTFFDAHASGRNLVVEWQTASEMDLLGFYLYRSTAPEGDYSEVSDGLIPSIAPGSMGGSDYRWVDDDASAGVTYYYKLEGVDSHGNRTSHGPVSAKLNYALYLPLVRKP